MDTRANPKNLTGERNVFCPQYRQCLDHAVKCAWQSWDCSRCDFRHSRCEVFPLESLGYNDGLSFYELSPRVAKVYYQRFC